MATSSPRTPVHVEVRRRPLPTDSISCTLKDVDVEKLVHNEVKRLPLLQDGLIDDFSDMVSTIAHATLLRSSQHHLPLIPFLRLILTCAV